MREIQLYNSLGGRREAFVPLVPGHASIYCCGPTVYGDPHIGNFRPVIVFDVLRRLLSYLGYEVTFVSNYTDVDDKIIRRAAELGISEKELADGIIGEYENLVEAVGALPPDLTPRPTVYMPEIIRYVADLVASGSAYVSEGDVYLRVRSIPDYGELSGNSIADLESGARIAIGERKEDPLDFALWKKTAEGVRWPSPWSEGRPGWHTECCVMIDSIFRKQNGLIDIHGGGLDLKFPHHENEMAQAKAHNGNRLAHYWIHNGFIDVNGEKMSKSLGNVILMKDVAREYGGLPFRLMLLSAHYRAPASYSEESMREAAGKWRQLQDTATKAAVALERHDLDAQKIAPAEESPFLAALCDDLNTPNALAALYDENKDLNTLLRARPLSLTAIADRLAKILSHEKVLGLGIAAPRLTADDKRLFAAYDDAKAKKDYARSDAIRETLMQKGLF